MMTTSQRKIEHLLLCAEKDVESHVSAGFENLYLIHKALPEINKNSIDLSVKFLNKKLNAPILISSMTGGHPDTKTVNKNLAIAAEELKIGIGVGSQRAALEDEKQIDSFKVVRDYAPSIFVYGNLGAVQLREYGISGVKKAIEMIHADAIAIHLNFLQESIQRDGDVNACGCLDAIKKVCKLDIPVIVKETGAGISYDVALQLYDAGVSAIDVGGLGGTSWAGVEALRNNQNLGKLFWDWGIPTTISIIECKNALKDFNKHRQMENRGIKPTPIIATGGIRNGLDCAKSIALGADLCGIALPLLKPAMQSSDKVYAKLINIIEELKVAMFLTGCDTVNKLKSTKKIIFQPYYNHY